MWWLCYGYTENILNLRSYLNVKCHHVCILLWNGLENREKQREKADVTKWWPVSRDKRDNRCSLYYSFNFSLGLICSKQQVEWILTDTISNSSVINSIPPYIYNQWPGYKLVGTESCWPGLQFLVLTLLCKTPTFKPLALRLFTSIMTGSHQLSSKLYYVHRIMLYK